MAAIATEVRLEPGPEAIGAARKVVTEAVEGRLDDGRLETLRLLVSEIVTNTVRHSGTREALELSLSLDGDVRVTVTDYGVGFEPRPGTPREDRAGGFGLYLVDRLSSRWGVANNSFTRVWFILPVGRRA